MGGDADTNPLSYQLQLSSDEGASWSPLTPVMTGTSHGLSTDLLDSGSKRLRIMVTDGFDTAWAVRSVTFTNPLKVTSVLPPNEAVSVDPGTSVSVLFATGLDEATLSTSTFQLQEGGTLIPVAGTVSYTRSPAWPCSLPRRRSSLAPLRGAAGRLPQGPPRQPIGHPVSMELLHGGGHDAARRRPHQSGPQRIGSALNALVQVVFSEPVKPSTLTSSSFRLLDASGKPVSGSVTPSTDQLAALFTSSAPLLPGVEYTAVVSATVEDLAGNPLEVSHSWTFTTGTTSSNGLRIIGNYSDQAMMWMATSSSTTSPCPWTWRCCSTGRTT